MVINDAILFKIEIIWDRFEEKTQNGPMELRIFQIIIHLFIFDSMNNFHFKIKSLTINAML